MPQDREYPTSEDLAASDELAFRALARRDPEEMDEEEKAWRKDWDKAMRGTRKGRRSYR